MLDYIYSQYKVVLHLDRFLAIVSRPAVSIFLLIDHCQVVKKSFHMKGKLQPSEDEIHPSIITRSLCYNL